MSDTYIVLAHYANKHRGSVVLGHFQIYEEAIEYMKGIEDYTNIQGVNIFTGGAVYSVPEQPVPKDKFQYMDLSFDGD